MRTISALAQSPVAADGFGGARQPRATVLRIAAALLEHGPEVAIAEAELTEMAHRYGCSLEEFEAFLEAQEVDGGRV
jgi:hypothetical protein